LTKSKLVKVLLIAFTLFLTLNIASLPSQHLRNPGTTQLASPFSQLFVSASTEPNVTLERLVTGGGDNETDVMGVFKNNEDVDVYGVATATVTIQPGDVQTLSSDRTLLPAQGTVSITITFNDLPFKNYYSCMISFEAEPIAGPTGGETETPTAIPSETAPTSGSPAGGEFNFASVGVPVISIAAVALASVTGVVMFRKTRLSEQKVRRFTSFEYQDWIMQRLGGHAGSVSDSRKGIDGFTGDNVPVTIKQSDSVGRLQVQNFMNALTQARVRNGIMIAFGFDNEAHAAVTMARMNRIDIKLVTVKELIEHKETALL
jgi:hypothetical protein